jgi:predicted amidohydrolase YtcJ
VVPGFNDAHADFVAAALALQQVDLTSAETIDDLEDALGTWAAQHPEREWIVGRGFSVDAPDAAAPTRAMLDGILADRPVVVLSRDGSTAWANSEALVRAGITRRTPNPADGVIGRDRRTGEPNGLLKDGAVTLVSKVLPMATRAERLSALRAAIDEAHRRGVTSVQDISASVDDLELYDALRQDKALDIRVYASLRATTDMPEAELDTLDAVRKKYTDDPLFKTGAITLVADEEGGAGEQLRDVVAELDARGWQVIIQAVGARAVQLARDAVEYASTRNPAPERGRRHRVEVVSETADPIEGVQLAVAEKRAVPAAVDAYTRKAAWASFDEHRKGSLERDMLADLVIFTHDIFARSDRAADSDVALTIFDGRVVYSRSAETNE